MINVTVQRSSGDYEVVQANKITRRRDGYTLAHWNESDGPCSTPVIRIARGEYLEAN